MDMALKTKSMGRNTILRNTIFFLFGLLIFSCKKNDDNDATALAKSFCKCMKENGSPKHYLYALTVCDGRYVKENRFYRMYRVDIRFGEQDRKLSNHSRDSTYQFINIFDDY